jgi:hypothetical protein
MKNRWLAAFLNFLLAGLGFVYLRKWAWAALDFIVTISIGMLLAFKFPSAIQTATIAIPVMNAVLAMQVAQQMNAHYEAQSKQASSTPGAIG